MMNLTMERRARSIFRDALIMHYMEGPLEAAADVEEWLRNHGGWIPDPQVLYGDGTPDDQPMDEGEDVTSSIPVAALRDAVVTMSSLIANLTSEIVRQEVQRFLVHGPIEEDDEHHRLDREASAWLTDYTNRGAEAFDSANLATMLSAAAANVATSFGGSSGITFEPIRRNRSRSRDFDAPFEDVLIGPGLLQGRENTIENYEQNSFTGSAYRLD